MGCEGFLIFGFAIGFLISSLSTPALILTALIVASFFVYYRAVHLVKLRSQTQKSAAIVICAHNEERVISRSLESSIKQTYEKLEKIIVVDDHSTDRTPEIVESYMRKDSRIALLRNEKNLGKFGSILRAVESFHADVYIFIDADNEIPKDYVEYYMEYMDRFDMLETPLSSYNVDNFTSILHTIELHLLNFARFSNIFPSFTGRGMFIKREIFDRIRIEGITGVDDGAVMNSMASRGFRYAHPFGTALEEFPTRNLDDFIHQRDRWYTRGMYEASLGCAKPYLVAMGTYMGFSSGLVFLSLFSLEHALSLLIILLFLMLFGILGGEFWSKDVNPIKFSIGSVFLFFLNTFLLLKSFIKVLLGKVPQSWYRVER